jgi:GDP-D-mannose dehydratase
MKPMKLTKHLDLGCGSNPRNPYHAHEIHMIDIQEPAKLKSDLIFKKANLNWEDHVKIDKRYLRPSEVDSLVGDASKAQKVLGWKAKTNWKKLAEIMVEADIQLLDDKLSGRKIDD